MLAAALLVAGGCDALFHIDYLDPPIIPDAAADAPGFSPPRKIEALASSAFDGDPTLTGDMLEIHFKSNRPGGAGGHDIWRSTRPKADAPWSTPARVAELSSPDSDTTCRIAPNGLTIWVRRTPAGGTGTTMVSTRPSRNDPWTTPVPVAGIDPQLGDAELGSATENTLVAYLSSARGSTTRPHIFRTTRASSSDPWSMPSEVPELLSETGTYSKNPWGAYDDLAIIFSSDRLGTRGSGDLWIATRRSVTDPFGEPLNLGEINGPDYEADPWMSPDFRHVVFTANTGGNYDIYEATR